MRILIIGGGASGMMAALTASETMEHEVWILERHSRMGRKLLATGNGRCNLTNRNMDATHYHGENAAFCRSALAAFDTERTLEFFRNLGLLTVTEDSGRVYPFSDSANSVGDVLRLTLEHRKNVHIVTSCEVARLEKENGLFTAYTREEHYEGERAILCAGGLAGGKLGGVDLGYRLLGTFGHSRTKLYPSLVQLRTDPTYVRSLKGVRCASEIRYGKRSYQGELQFTEYGVSGPVIFELSREAAVCGGGLLEIDLLPEVSSEELAQMLHQRCKSLPWLKTEDLLTGVLHNRLGRTVLRMCGISADRVCGELTWEEQTRIAASVKRTVLAVTGTMGMDNAQVTAGGIRTEEFDPETMESRLCPGLFACGEVLDIDGDCGGYNLQWAWSSGRLAGRCATMK